MIQLTTTIMEQNGAVTTQTTGSHESPTASKILVLKQECELRLSRHSDAIQAAAERLLIRLNQPITARDT